MRNHRWIRLLLLLAFTAAFTFGSSEQRVLRLSGKVVGTDGKALRFCVVFLSSAVTPFNTWTQADSAGEFNFKSLLPGVYNLFVATVFAGEISETIEVGPSFADKKGRIRTKVVFDRLKAIPPRHGVSVTALSIPSNARNEYRKAMALAEKRNFEGAAERLKHAIEIAPQYSDAWNFLGTISFQAGVFQEAEKYFREALKYDGNAFDPLVNLGGTMLALHRYEDSLPPNLQAVKIRPNDALAQSQLGQSYFHLGQLEESEIHLKKAKALDPAHFTLPQIVLAAIYRRRGDYIAAIRELEEFLSLHPDSATAPYARKELANLRALVPRDKEVLDNFGKLHKLGYLLDSSGHYSLRLLFEAARRRSRSRPPDGTCFSLGHRTPPPSSIAGPALSLCPLTPYRWSGALGGRRILMPIVMI